VAGDSAVREIKKKMSGVLVHRFAIKGRGVIAQGAIAAKPPRARVFQKGIKEEIASIRIFSQLASHLMYIILISV
jgi:hypothetical protein